MGRNFLSIKQKFFDRIYPEPNTGCWIWAGPVQRNGYGSISHNDQTIKTKVAHRYSYIHFKGLFDSKLCVCHSCDNPWCVNPDHLFLGTVADNMQDMVRKGRHKKRKPKLTDDQIADIKSKYKNGYTQCRIAEMHNVTQGAIFYHLNDKKH